MVGYHYNLTLTESNLHAIIMVHLYMMGHCLKPGQSSSTYLGFILFLPPQDLCTHQKSIIIMTP